VFFEPSWGEFDMAVGCSVTSVFGGPADREAYGSMEVGEATTSPARESPFTADELALFDMYAELRSIREALKASPNDSSIAERLDRAIARVHSVFPKEWLLRLECL